MGRQLICTSRHKNYTVYYLDVVYVFPGYSFSINTKGNIKFHNNHSTKYTQFVIYTFIIISKQWNS